MDDTAFECEFFGGMRCFDCDGPADVLPEGSEGVLLWDLAGGIVPVFVSGGDSIAVVFASGECGAAEGRDCV